MASKASILQNQIHCAFTSVGGWVAMLVLRLFIGYEFFMAGLKKYYGTNWFARIQEDFICPFHLIPVEVNWFLATWTELVGGVAIALGLLTRFWVVSLIILTIVALYAVHIDNGYNVCKNGFKMHIIYMAMMIPILLNGAGKLSLDHLIRLRLSR